MADNVETQPLDIMTVSPPVSTPDRVPSPDEPTDSKRERYQTKPVSKKEETREFTESENEAGGTWGLFLFGTYFSTNVQQLKQSNIFCS